MEAAAGQPLPTVPAQSDAPVVARIDPQWLNQQWLEYRRWVAAILLAYKPRWADLDDLLQDVALAVVRKGQKYAAQTSLEGGDDEEGVIARIASGQATPAAEFEQRKEGERLVDICAQIPDGYREPLLLKAVRGMSYREIGEVLNLPETTVETRIARARKKLAEILT